MEPISWPAAPVPDPPEQAQSQSGCLNAALFALAAAWVVGVTVVVQASAWVYDQFQLINGTPLPGWVWVLLAIGQALLLTLPVAPLAYFTRAPRFRAAYLAWAIAIGCGALLGLARLCPVTWTQPAAIIQIALTLPAAFASSRLRIRGVKSSDVNAAPLASSLQPPASSLALALSVGLLVALPWLHYGPLGSPLDTLLDLLAALSLGLFAGVLLDRFLLGPLVAHTSGALRDVGFGGVAAGVALLVLGAGFGYGGSQIPLLIVLAPLGGAALAIGRLTTETTEITEKKMGSDLLPSSVPPVPSATQIATETTEITEKEIGSDPAQPSVRSVLSVARSGWLPIAALVGVAAAGPLLFLDPDEFSLALGLFEVGQALWAAWLALLIATLLGLALWALAAWRRRPLGALPALGGLVAAIAAAALVYGYAGRPGFYGEQLFVVLRDQADVSQAAKIADRTERLRSVYTTLTRHADTTQADLRATLDSLGVAYRPYYLVNGLEVDGGPLLRAYLATRPEVERILDNPRLRPLSGAEPPLTGTSPAPEEPQWNVIAIGADRVWDDLGVTGKGIVVGESDSGVQGDHPALRDSYRGRGGRDDYSWLDPWNHSTAPVDVGGHGTHTTGSIVGRGGIGVAPGAEWIGCVNLARNLGNPAYYLDCLQFMLAPYPRSGDPFKDGDPARAAHVLNNSWGCPPIEGCDPGSLLPAVRALHAAGIFVVASAGNEGPRCSSVEDPIAIYDAVFSVGAIDQDGNLADFSSRGPVTVDGSDRVKPDIVAPGVGVLSALPGGTYGPLDGTSMAGPHVAGVVALMWSAQPKLIGNIDRTEQILQETARPYEGMPSGCFDGSVPGDGAGYGVVDAYEAVKAALAEP